MKISEALKPSFATQVIRAASQKNNQANCSIFPTTFVYSFEQAGLCLTVTFLPSSEANTQIRYDLFNSSSKTETDENALANAVGDVLQNFVKNLENGFKSVNGRLAGSSTATHGILKQIQEHQKLERKNGGQILPAMRQPKGSSLFQQAEQCEFPFCICFLAKSDYLFVYSVQRNQLFWSWIKRKWIWWTRLVDSSL